ncbi:MAG: hypothetical protein ACI8RD_007979, partial [Bacillariaceae sp.]
SKKKYPKISLLRKGNDLHPSRTKSRDSHLKPMCVSKILLRW